MPRAKAAKSKAKRVNKLFGPPSVKPAAPKAIPEFESLGVSSQQIEKAISALIAYTQRKSNDKETELLESDNSQNVWLNVTLKRMSPREKHMPIKLPLPHPLVNPKVQPVCLITKDPQRKYKDLLEEKKVSFISKVVGCEKLAGKYKPFEARRALLKEYDVFLADERVIPEMPRLLGKAWFEAKKQPIPVNITRADIKAQLEQALCATYLHLPRGTALSIRIGNLERHSQEELVANIRSVIPHLAAKLPDGGWQNVQALGVKTGESAMLPVWNCTLDAEGRFNEVEGAAEAKAEKVAAKEAKRKERDEQIQERKAKKNKATSDDEEE